MWNKNHKQLVFTDYGRMKHRNGQWEHYEGMLTCSQCGTQYYDDIMEYCGDDVPRYCPNCGANMAHPANHCQRCGIVVDDGVELCDKCMYEAQVEMEQYNRLYEPTYNSEDGSM